MSAIVVISMPFLMPTFRNASRTSPCSILSGVHYLGLGVADADVVVETLVYRAIDVLLDGTADDCARTCVVVIRDVGASARETHS